MFAALGLWLKMDNQGILCLISQNEPFGPIVGCVCVFERYSQCPQLGHVVEAGQRYEGDVIVVEGAGWRHKEGKSKAEKNI